MSALNIITDLEIIDFVQTHDIKHAIAIRHNLQPNRMIVINMEKNI